MDEWTDLKKNDTRRSEDHEHLNTSGIVPGLDYEQLKVPA